MSFVQCVFSPFYTCKPGYSTADDNFSLERAKFPLCFERVLRLLGCARMWMTTSGEISATRVFAGIFAILLEMIPSLPMCANTWRASASGRVHRVSTCCVIRGASSRRVRCSSASGRVHRASAGRNRDADTLVEVHRTSVSRVIRDVSSSWVRCASASSGVHRASACRDRDTCAGGRVHRASSSCVIRGIDSRLVHCASTSVHHASAYTIIRGRVHRDNACQVIHRTSAGRVRSFSASGQVHHASACCVIRGASSAVYTAPAPMYITTAPALIATPWSSTLRQRLPGHTWHQRRP